jgi:cell division protein FtsL
MSFERGSKIFLIPIQFFVVLFEVITRITIQNQFYNINKELQYLDQQFSLKDIKNDGN